MNNSTLPTPADADAAIIRLRHVHKVEVNLSDLDNMAALTKTDVGALVAVVDGRLSPSQLLWAVHVRGADDIHPAESYEAALATCDALLAEDRRLPLDEFKPMFSAVPMIWPGSAEEHAAALPTALRALSATDLAPPNNPTA